MKNCWKFSVEFLRILERLEDIESRLSTGINLFSLLIIETAEFQDMINPVQNSGVNTSLIG